MTKLEVMDKKEKNTKEGEHELKKGNTIRCPGRGTISCPECVTGRDLMNMVYWDNKSLMISNCKQHYGYDEVPVGFPQGFAFVYFVVFFRLG